MRVFSLFVAGMFLAASVSAAPLTISNITGQWQNPDADGATAPTVTINNAGGSAQDEIRWGLGFPNPADPNSGYLFDPEDGAIVPALNSVFALGVFTHENFPISPFGFFGAEYDLSFDTNGVPNTLNNVFVFDHNETPNDGPCPVGVPPCADIVTVSQTIFNQIIDVDGELYFFNLLGFSTDGGNTFSTTFISGEGNANVAVLYAQVTETAIPQVPEPASLGLIGVGLALIGHQVRRRRKTN